MPASRNGRRKVTWEWLVRDGMANLLENGGSRTAFSPSDCAQRCTYPNHTNAMQFAPAGVRALRQNVFAGDAEGGC